MKRVCHVSSAHGRYDTRILYRECKSLSKKYETIFVVNDNLPDEIIDGVTIKTTGNSSMGRFKRMLFGVTDSYRVALKVDADIYHLHDPELLRIALKLKRKGKKVIFDSHEAYYDQIKVKEYLPGLIRKVVAELYYRYETYVCKRIDGVVMPATLEGINIFEGRCKRFELVNNLPRKDEIPQMQIKKYSERSGGIYSGSLTQARGITQLVDSSPKAGLVLTLAGKFQPDEYENEVMKSNKNEDTSYIRHVGFVDREKVYKLYNEAAIGFAVLQDVGQYAKGDNLPTKVYEYMAMEMPVILSDFPHYRKMIEKYQFGLTVKQDDVDDIVQKIKYLLDNPEEAEKMGINGKKAFQEIFNWETAEKNLYNIYENIINERK